MRLRGPRPVGVARLVAVLCTVAAGVGAPAAHADDGLTVDPSSPSGHEYAVPLDAARQEALGQDSPKSASGSPGGAAPAFGAGVGPGTTKEVSGTNSNDRAGSGVTGKAGAAGGPPNGRDHRATIASDRLAAQQLASYRLAGTSGTSSSWTVLMLVIGGIAFVLVLVGRFSRRSNS